MKTQTELFAARVKLPCTVFCGPGSMLEIAGTAVSIDTGSMVLSMERNDGKPGPELGERVRVEMVLPADSALDAAAAPPKCLAVRARVVHVTDMPDGTRQFGFSFRKPSFKDRPAARLRKPASEVRSEWEM